MSDKIKVYGSEEHLNEIKNKKDTIFACVMSTTKISEIPNLTGAGMSAELTKYTPAVDVEVIMKDQPLSFPEIAMTKSDELGAPSPAVLTKAMVDLLGIRFIPIDAGAEITPKVPYISLNGKYGGDLREGKGVEDPEEIIENAKKVGKELSKLTSHLMIGESTPAGTTTAQGVLTAFGYDVKDKISGSMKTNPHELKDSIVNSALKTNNIKPGELKHDPIKALKIAGDPTLAAVAGLVLGSDTQITLAGGTQMVAACSVIKALKPDFDFSKISLATTKYVVEDETSNMLDIAKQVGDMTVYAADPFFENSINNGLINYTKGSAKEGVGAGGSVFLAYAMGVTPEEYLEKVEEICDAQFKE